MTFQEINELIRTISRSRLAEFKLKDGEFELSIKTDSYSDMKGAKVVQAPIQIAAPPVAAPIVQQPVAVSAPAPPAQMEAAPPPTAVKEAAAPPAAKAPAGAGKYLEVKSPMVGTFYRSRSPEKPPFVEIGQSIKKGDVVCIIEAMKLFNEIESEVEGKVVKVMLDNAKAVEYDQVLFLVEPE